MARLRFRTRRSTGGSNLLLVALGAVTGLALGVVLAERTGGVAGVRSRVRDLRRRGVGSSDSHEAMETGDTPVLPYDLPHDLPHDAVYEDYDDDDLDDHASYADDDDDADDDALEAALDGQTERGPDEDELESRVLEAFRNDPTLRQRAIDIGALGNGIIELTGWVHGPDEVRHAVTLARGVPDVVHVMDSLIIRGADGSRVGPPSSDR